MNTAIETSYHHTSSGNPVYYNKNGSQNNVLQSRIYSQTVVDSRYGGYDTSYSTIIRESNNMGQMYSSPGRRYFNSERPMNYISSQMVSNHIYNEHEILSHPLFYPSWDHIENNHRRSTGPTSLAQNPTSQRSLQMHVGYRANGMRKTTKAVKSQCLIKKHKYDVDSQKENNRPKIHKSKKSSRMPQKRFSFLGLPEKSAYFEISSSDKSSDDSCSSKKKIIPLTTNVPRTVKVVDYSENGRVHLFPSCSEASRATSINRTKISRSKCLVAFDLYM